MLTGRACRHGEPDLHLCYSDSGTFSAVLRSARSANQTPEADKWQVSGDRENVDVIAHELSHSWSGNLVTSCSWEHL